jgi:hypothetical protein
LHGRLNDPVWTGRRRPLAGGNFSDPGYCSANRRSFTDCALADGITLLRSVFVKNGTNGSLKRIGKKGATDTACLEDENYPVFRQPAKYELV